jgi:hypothetical protein
MSNKYIFRIKLIAVIDPTCADVDVLAERSHAGDHPLGSGLGVHRDGGSRGLAQRPQPPAELVGSLSHLGSMLK